MGFLQQLDLSKIGTSFAEPNEVLSGDCTWDHFLKKLQSYYKPTENPIIHKSEFRQLVQVKNKTFSAFCNRLETRTLRSFVRKGWIWERCCRRRKIFGYEVNKVGAYSYQRIRNEKTKLSTKKCYRSDPPFSTKHLKECKALKAKCSNCKKIGHFAKVCRQQKNVNVLTTQKNRKMSLRK